MDNKVIKGEKHLHVLIATIIILQVSTNLSDNIPLLFSVPRLSLLFILFYFLLRGANWSKWLLVLYTLALGLGGIGASWFLITNREVLPANFKMGIIAGCIGIIYILSFIGLLFSKETKIYLANIQTNKKEISVRNQFSSILIYVGIAVIICFETTLLPLAATSALANPNLLKKILLLIFLLPVKIPYYAIPGIVIILISNLVSKDEKREE